MKYPHYPIPPLNGPSHATVKDYDDFKIIVLVTNIIFNIL